jgi:hypothetical protein
MNLPLCTREKEVAALINSGRWPHACEDTLRDHVAKCARCQDLLLVSQTLQRDRATLVGQARLVAPSLLWWRAQLRRRYAAVERIGRPITRAQVFALAVNLILAVSLLVSQARGVHWIAWFTGLEQSPAFHPGALLSSVLLGRVWNLEILLPSIGLLVLLSAIAVYLASDKP